MDKSDTGIDFRNLIIEKETFNIFKYQYFYNGGGVAVGDFNNDSLEDIVFTGNMVKNRLFLNKGNLKFEDITISSGIAAQEGWCTGVTTVDINCDGYLDIYICRAGYPFERLTKNLLYINNGNLTFTEKAAEYGLDDSAHSTQASFFDYDKDGDLDMFLINHSEVEYSRGSLEVFQMRGKKQPDKTNKLYRNDQGKFVNITEQAGITSNVLSFSLGLNIADINNDNWLDIFIGNDFNEPDYLFINNQDGTFTDKLSDYFDHIAMFSMGGDIADINNDCLPDIINLDMLPETNEAQKMHSGADNFDKVSNLIRNGFFRQYSRNMLQINNGNGTFSECGQMAGVSNTDWSWSPLFLDFNNDGWKDLFVSNGYLRDHTDMDFLKFTEEEVQRIQKGEKNIEFSAYMAKMPPINQPNYFFLNEGNLRFKDMTKAWGLDIPSVSQGSAYADFDHDGDLDLVTNMSNEEAGFYENRTNTLAKNAFLTVKLQGDKCNADGIGSKVYVYANGKSFYQEQQPVRGFQSSSSTRLHFGLGDASSIDSVVVVWNTDQKQVIKNCSINTVLTLKKSDAAGLFERTKTEVPLFRPLDLPPDMVHYENQALDLHTQFLLPWYQSKEGPALAVADLNMDTYPDFYLGGAIGFSGKLYLSTGPETWSAILSPFEADKMAEDQAAVFFDADGDKDLDLYVASGSYEQNAASKQMEDRLYLNLGPGKFERAKIPLPESNSSCIATTDVDGDGDTDIFVGAFVTPQRFPEHGPSTLLLNDGKGHFGAQQLNTSGLVKDAVWCDIDGDKKPELVVAAEWSPLQVYKWNGSGLELQPDLLPESSSGLWQSVHASDLDKDGDLDLVAGNLGTNNQLYASKSQPLSLYFADFDGNGSIDPVLCRYYDNQLHPLASKEDLLGQMRFLTKKYLYFKDYAKATINDIFNADQLKKATKWEVHTLETAIFMNENGHFKAKSLPVEAQIAPVSAIETIDADADGMTDLLLAGNMSSVRVKLGRLDGNHGLLLKGGKDMSFQAMPYPKTGFKVRGDVRSIAGMQNQNRSWMIFGVNDGPVQIYTKTK